MYVGKIAKTRAVRKGGLLRGKVSQGRPRPLRHGVKERRSDTAKQKIIAELYAERLFFPQQSVGMTMAQLAWV